MDTACCTGWSTQSAAALSGFWVVRRLLNLHADNFYCIQPSSICWLAWLVHASRHMVLWCSINYLTATNGNKLIFKPGCDVNVSRVPHSFVTHTQKHVFGLCKHPLTTHPLRAYGQANHQGMLETLQLTACWRKLQALRKTNWQALRCNQISSLQDVNADLCALVMFLYAYVILAVSVQLCYLSLGKSVPQSSCQLDSQAMPRDHEA